MSTTKAKTPAERKAAQRKRDRKAGFNEYLIRCHSEDWPSVRDYVEFLRKQREAE